MALNGVNLHFKSTFQAPIGEKRPMENEKGFPNATVDEVCRF